MVGFFTFWGDLAYCVAHPAHPGTTGLRSFSKILQSFGGSKAKKYILIFGKEKPQNTLTLYINGPSVISIEMPHAGEIFEGTEQDIRDFMDSKGYAFVDTIKIDDIFLKKELMKK